MKISRETMTKKLQYVVGRLSRRPDLTLAEIQRRLVRRFGSRLAHPTLRTTVDNYFFSGR